MPEQRADAVEAALASALAAAAANQRWDVVVHLARELEARRLANDPKVLPFAPRERAERSGQR